MTVTGGQMYLDDMFSMTRDDYEKPSGSSEIASFYGGRKILVTGGSGFVGKLLVEKLLRSCSDLGTIYLFMRTKKGKSPEERFEQYFNDTVFDRLKKEQLYYKEKILMIEGDMSQIGLGLSPESRERLNDTEIILHAAATVRFDEKLSNAVNINVRGTKELLLLARQIPNFKVFVYVSTAFSHCYRKFIDETFYEPPMDADKIITLMDILNQEELDDITPKLIGKWPNTYTYTKAIAEETVRKYSKGIHSCIVRPSIMVATSTEPVNGWINNLYGPTGVVMGVAYGVLRTLHCKEDLVADLIPADIVINNIIAAGWDVAQKCENELNVTDANENKCTIVEEVPIYNCVSSVQNKITWGEFMKLVETNGIEVPSEKAFWYYMFMFSRYKFLYYIAVIFLHYLPAIVVDAILLLKGSKPMLWQAYKKIHKFSDVIAYFSTQEWLFKNDGTINIWNKMSPVDKEMFHFNVKDLDWSIYFCYYIRGLRQYIANDPLDTVDRGRVKFRKLKIAHYTILTLVSLLILWGVYSLLHLTFAWIFSP